MTSTGSECFRGSGSGWETERTRFRLAPAPSPQPQPPKCGFSCPAQKCDSVAKNDTWEQRDIEREPRGIFWCPGEHHMVLYLAQLQLETVLPSRSLHRNACATGGLAAGFQPHSTPAPASAARHQQCIRSPLAGGEYTLYKNTVRR